MIESGLKRRPADMGQLRKDLLSGESWGQFVIEVLISLRSMRPSRLNAAQFDAVYNVGPQAVV
jgi:hypothetical protein